MFPKDMDFEFYLDSIKFVIIMFIVATIGMLYCAYLYFMREVSFFSIYYVLSIRNIDNNSYYNVIMLV